MRVPRLASGLALLALAAGLAGCGTSTDGTEPVGDTPSSARAPQSESTSPAAEGSSAAVPSTSPTQATSKTPKAKPSPTADEEETREGTEPAARGLVGRLLTAEEVPGFNAEFTWRVGATRKREGRQPFGTCSRFPMTSIGATKVVTRTYVPTTESPGSSASNLVARFADEMTAKRAYAVLESWRGQCEEELRSHEQVELGSMQPVAADGAAAAEWYLLTYGPADGPDSAYFDAQGLVRSGSTISALQMRLVGQDYNYPAGEEPMVTAVRNSAARLG